MLLIILKYVFLFWREWNEDNNVKFNELGLNGKKLMIIWVLNVIKMEYWFW